MLDETTDTRGEIKKKLRENFDGKIVRKDLTKKIKEGANVPVYVLEFLLGQYCSSDDDAVIDKITVSLNIKRNVYEAEFSNLGLRGIPIADEYPEKYDRLHCYLPGREKGFSGFLLKKTLMEFTKKHEQFIPYIR